MKTDAPRPPQADIDRLRDARSRIDPKQQFRMELPDGQILSLSGTELIETADAMVEFDEAVASGNRTRITAALRRLEAL